MEIMNLLKRSILELIAYQKQLNTMLEQRFIARSRLSDDDIRNKILCQEKMDHCYELVKRLSDRLLPKQLRRPSQVIEPKSKKPLWDNR